MSRFPYYFAWVIAEGACNLAGIGFSGYDGNKNPKWYQVSSHRDANELGSVLPTFMFSVWNSLRTSVVLLKAGILELINGWSTVWKFASSVLTTADIYERVSFSPVAMTFLCSAVWHGFYGGYYLSFMSAAFIIQSARSMSCLKISTHLLQLSAETFNLASSLKKANQSPPRSSTMLFALFFGFWSLRWSPKLWQGNFE